METKIAPLLNPTILVTGATGYLGSHLVRRLVQLNCPVVGLSRDVANIKTAMTSQAGISWYSADVQGIKKAFNDNKVDFVIHCATSYGRNKEPLEVIEAANKLLPTQILKQGLESGLKGFINTHTLLDRDTNLYSQTKYQFLDILSQSSEHLICCNVALEHFYGPLDHESKFVSWIVKSCLIQIPTIPLTLGEQKRDFIYIDDVVAAYEKILKWVTTQKNPGFYNFEVGTGKMTSIREAVELIHSLCGSKKTALDFGKIPYRTNEKMVFEVDLGAMQNIGWKAEVSFYEGLQKTINAERSKMREQV